MTKNTQNTWARRLASAVVLAALMATGQVATQPAQVSQSDGIPRCC